MPVGCATTTIIRLAYITGEVLMKILKNGKMVSSSPVDCATTSIIRLAYIAADILMMSLNMANSPFNNVAGLHPVHYY